MADWKQWEGDVVDGLFPLTRLLGSGAHSAVFLTRVPAGSAAIKLIPNPRDARLLVERWRAAAALEHPHLLRILNAGTWTKGGLTLAYVVTEYAEENLGTVLAERALASDEVLEMLPAVAGALTFLHARGFALGGLKPANIFAIDDTLKLSSDAIAPGDAAPDMRAVAATVTEALTRNAGAPAESLPEPFREIVRGCLSHNWSAADVANGRSKPGRAKAKAGPTSYLLGVGSFLIAVIVVGSVWRNRQPAPLAPPAPAQAASQPISQPMTQPTTQPMTQPASQPAEKPAPVASDPVKPAPPVREPRSVSTAPVSSDQVVSQALPEIPDKARRTIRGSATVAVKVAVDASGEVTDAALQPGGSRYFGRLAVKAARQWRFVAASGENSRKYVLRFEMTRTDTKVALER